jgi:hypothetical protein
MQVRRLPALAGWRWVTEGFAILAASPMPLIASGILVIFTLLAVSIPPVLGQFLPLVLSPALSFGYLQAIRQAQAGKPPAPWTVFSGLRPRPDGPLRALLTIGLFNATATALAILATAPVDEGQWMRMLIGPAQQPSAPQEPTGDTVYAAIVFLALYTPLQLALWYAPLFAGLHRTTALQSLFFSIVAVWRNKGAFLTYFASWFVVAVGIAVLIQILAAILPAGLRTLVLAPAFLLMMAALYCSFWPSYRDAIDPIAVDSTL